MALQYFLKVDGVIGDVTDKAHKGWFAVDDYDIGVTTPFSSAAGTEVTGRTQFSPLTVDIHSLTGVTALLEDELTNKSISSVELVGVETTAKGTQQTVYDLKLTDALVGSFENDPGSKGVETALTFHYDSARLTDASSPRVTAEWSTTTNTDTAVVGDSVSSASSTSDGGFAAVAVPANSPVRYFLKVDGVIGDVTDKAHKGWFAVDGYDIGVTTPFSSAAGTEVTGRRQFSPLSVDIHSLTGVSALLEDELTNKSISSVELVGVETTAKGTQQTVYDLKLTDALVGSFENDPGSKGVETALTFHYDTATLTDASSPRVTAEWSTTPNTDTAVVGDSVSSASSTSDGGFAAVAVPINSPVRYFLKVDGVIGDVTDKAHKGWFAVDGYDIGVTTPFSSAAGTEVTGRRQFSPLSVDIHSLTGVSALLADELTNKSISSVELVGVGTTAKGTQQTVYDLKLTDALIGSFENDPGSKGVETALTFHYDTATLTDASSPRVTAEWSTTTNTDTAAVGDSVSSASSTSDGGFAAVAVPANSPVRYFLKVDGVIGDVTDKAHKGWFAVDGYDIGVTTPFSSAAVTGRTQFSPLSVDIHSLTGVSALLADELTNKSISSVELVGVETTAKGTQQTVYDLKLTDALVGSFENDPGSKGVETALTFHYDSARLTDASSPRVTAEWSTTTNTDTAVVGDSVSSASSTSDGGFAAVAVPANSPVRYFLKVDGVIGDVTDKAHKGWFAVDGYDIGVTTPFSSAAGTEVTGRRQFSPLSVDIHSLTGVSALLEDELTNKSISSVELVGVETTAKGTQQTVYDLKLTDALVGSFENDPGSKGVETALTFHYDTATLTDASSPRVTAEWSTTPNTDTAVVGDSVSSASSTSDGGFAAVAVPINSPVRYFLKVDGVIGDVTDKAHKGWFAVDGYDIGVTTPFSSAAGTEVTGRTQFSPLSVDIHSLTGVSALLEDELTNKSISSVELVGVETTAKGLQQTVYDLKLTDALVGSFENDPGSKDVETALTFHYDKATLTDHSLGPNGQLGPAETVAFDTSTNNTASVLSSFMASSNLGSGSLASSVFTPLTHQDHPWPS